LTLKDTFDAQSEELSAANDQLNEQRTPRLPRVAHPQAL
jgi:hypothetical protein